MENIIKPSGISVFIFSSFQGSFWHRKLRKIWWSRNSSTQHYSSAHEKKPLRKTATKHIGWEIMFECEIKVRKVAELFSEIMNEIFFAFFSPINLKYFPHRTEVLKAKFSENKFNVLLSAENTKQLYLTTWKRPLRKGLNFTKA